MQWLCPVRARFRAVMGRNGESRYIRRSSSSIATARRIRECSSKICCGSGCDCRRESDGNPEPVEYVDNRDKPVGFLQENIAIIGGGIGGVAAAVALHQAGISTTLYERSREFREAGAGMMLWPNATRVLREMGLLEKLIARSGPNTNFLVRASYGTVLLNIALGQFDVPAVCSRRSDLLAVLLDALPPERVRLGCELTHLEQTGSKVRLHFRGPDGGRQIEEHGAAIGADGLHSQVREALFGPSAPIYRGYAVWRGVASYHGT